MLKINKKNEEIVILGDSDALKDEIGTLMLALCGEAAKRSKDAAADIYKHYVESVAGIGSWLKVKYKVDVDAALEELNEDPEAEEKEVEKTPPIDKKLDDAISAFFSALDNIIEEKKGDK